MKEKEEKYIENKLEEMRAIVLGSLWGAYMFPPTNGNWGDSCQKQVDIAMEVIEKDVRKLYKYAQKQK